MPPLDREMFSGSVDAGFVLALPFHHGDLGLCRSLDEGGGGEGAERRTQGGEMLPTLAVGWRASALRSEEAGRFLEVAGVSVVAVGGQRSR